MLNSTATSKQTHKRCCMVSLKSSNNNYASPSSGWCMVSLKLSNNNYGSTANH